MMIFMVNTGKKHEKASERKSTLEICIDSMDCSRIAARGPSGLLGPYCYSVSLFYYRLQKKDCLTLSQLPTHREAMVSWVESLLARRCSEKDITRARGCALYVRAYMRGKMVVIRSLTSSVVRPWKAASPPFASMKWRREENSRPSIGKSSAAAGGALIGDSAGQMQFDLAGNRMRPVFFALARGA